MSEVVSSKVLVLGEHEGDATSTMTAFGSADLLESGSNSSGAGPFLVGSFLESHLQLRLPLATALDATTCVKGMFLRLPESVAADQAYFWTPRWQQGEREAQADINAGRVKRFKTAKDLIAELND